VASTNIKPISPQHSRWQRIINTKEGKKEFEVISGSLPR
jgi:hypothetical protein